jgi:hypothetical protein
MTGRGNSNENPRRHSSYRDVTPSPGGIEFWSVLEMIVDRLDHHTRPSPREVLRKTRIAGTMIPRVADNLELANQ